jgi:Mrp family chromosome partitioning ATPase
MLGPATSSNESRKSSSDRASRPARTQDSSNDFVELIRSLFQHPSAIAIVGSCCAPDSDTGPDSASFVAEGLAAELGSTGNRVVVVPVTKLLRMNPVILSERSAFLPGRDPHVWMWPASFGQTLEFFECGDSRGKGDWLDSLRRNFYSVVLDCPYVEGMPGVTEVAAMADAAVLAVEAHRTSREQIQRNQQVLQVRGIRIAGCILIQERLGRIQER